MHTATRIAALALLALPSITVAQPHDAEPAITWDNIGRLIEAQERQGFCGSVLLVRNGEIVLNEGYGLADREHGTPNTADTIFALGSTPIDFTRVAAIQLIDAGKLGLDDPISKFFDRIPEDKQPITVRHIMDSSTGLPDFPNIPGVDADPDHSPLSRDEFVQRFRNAELRFEPGEGEEHSHFAWGVLAAVVEVASGQSYQDYVRERILKPAGMTRTGFNGDEFPGEVVAHGYGFKSWGPVNTPPQWGPPSWLVMGSGGMVGTTGDLYRFHQALDNGTLLPESVRHLYPSSAVYSNGDMYGFETWYNYGPGDRFYINCNANNPMDPRHGYNLQPLAEQLVQLVTGRTPPRFSIGIAFGIEADPRGERLVADEVPEGRPAYAAGLRPGDILVSANGTPFDPDNPLEAIRDGIEQGTPLTLAIEREGKPLTIRITPRPIANDD